MKKILILTLVLGFCCLGRAQTGDTLKIKAAAAEYCACMDPHLKAIHPLIIEMLYVVLANGEKAAKDTLDVRLAASPGERDAVAKSAVYMESNELVNAVAKCDLALQAKCPFFDKKDPGGAKNQEYFEKVLARLPECKIVYLMALIADRAED